MRYPSIMALLIAAAALLASPLAQAQPGRPGPGPSGQRVLCESNDNHYRECRIPAGARVELARRLSDAACVKNRTWGVKGNRVWVNRGCRAEFSVRKRKG